VGQQSSRPARRLLPKDFETLLSFGFSQIKLQLKIQKYTGSKNSNNTDDDQIEEFVMHFVSP
jgi:hypothetical protein